MFEISFIENPVKTFLIKSSKTKSCCPELLILLCYYSIRNYLYYLFYCAHADSKQVQLE